jgi:hypothetical protein
LQASAACAPGYEMVVQAGKDGLKDGGASCSACVCDPSVLACGQTVVTTAMGATCASGPCTTTTLEPNGCVSVGDDESCASPDYLSATSPVMGQCVPTGGALDAGVSWTYSTLACGPADGGATCSNGACLPPTPVGGYTCIYSTTQTICPATFPNLFASYTGTTSTLSCSSCTCGSPGGCTTKVFGYSTPCMGQGDGGPIATPPTPLGDCTPRGLILSIKETAPPLPPAAGCPAGGGDLSGSVVPDPQTLTTFCCE